MTCEEIRNLLQDYLYEGEKLEEGGWIRQHLASCEACREEYVLFGQVKGLLEKWEAPEIPQGLAESVLSRIASSPVSVIERMAERIGLSGGALRAGLSITMGILASALSVFLVSKGLSESAAPLNLQVICVAYWALSFGILFHGALPGWKHAAQEGLFGEGTLKPKAVCISVLAALGMGGLLAFGSILLRAEPARRLVTLAPSMPESFLFALVFFLVGAVFALLSQFLGVAAALGTPEGGPLAFGLVTGCVFTIVVTPALSIVCVPFTLGIFASTLTGCFLGAAAGGTLGFEFRRRLLLSA